jgi:hypothetical protein
MTQEDIQDNSAETIKATQYATTLAAMPEFQEWMSRGPKARILHLVEDLLSTKRGTAGWKDEVCDKLVAIQEAQLTYVALFDMQLELATLARETLKKMSQPEQ